jgi:hypothetical protein
MNIWDVLAKDTNCSRDKCKAVCYGLLYGEIVKVCINMSVDIEEVVSIRVAFDDYIRGKLK